MPSRRTDITVVTSCSLRGWQEYGKKCIPTIFKHWPNDITVHLVSEDQISFDNLPILDKGRFTTWALQNSEHEKVFREKNKFNAVARGKKGSTSYSYLFDAWKFSKKVFAIDLVASQIKCGWLLWLDADIKTYKPLPREVLERVLPEGHNLSYLARKTKHTECGFVGYNLNVLGTREFIRSFAAAYSSGLVFNLKEWHDSWVFDWLRKASTVKGYEIPHTSEQQPFNYSELGQYMDHLKGPRKLYGYSKDHPRFLTAK